MNAVKRQLKKKCLNLKELVNALLNNEDIKEYSEETKELARKILEDSGAQGDTLDELVEDMKVIVANQKGGRTLTKDKK